MNFPTFSFRLNKSFVVALSLICAITFSFVGCKDKEETGQEEVADQVGQGSQFSTEIRSLSEEDLAKLGAKNNLSTEFIYPGAYFAQVLFPERVASLEEDGNAVLDFFAQSVFQLPVPEILAKSKIAIYSKGFTFDVLKNAQNNEVIQEGFVTPVETVYLSTEEPFDKAAVLAQVFQNVKTDNIKKQQVSKYEVNLFEEPMFLQLGSTVGKIDSICAGVAFPTDNSIVFISGTPDAVNNYFSSQDGDSRGIAAQRLGRLPLDSAAAVFQYDYDPQFCPLPLEKTQVVQDMTSVIQEHVSALQFVFDLSKEDGDLLTLTVNAKTEDGANEIRKAIGTALMKSVDALGQLSKQAEAQSEQALSEIESVVNLLKSVNLAADGSNVVGTLKNSQNSVQFFINTIKGVNDAQANAEIYMQIDMASQMLTQLSQAFAAYYRQNSVYPTPIYDDNGVPLLSWRVALLPFLGEPGQKLYEQFKLDEPWNSDANIKLLNQMPTIYMSPTNPTATTKTQFLIFNAPETPFGRHPKGLKIQDVADPSRTLSIVMAASEHAIEWTRPENFAFNPNKPTDSFGPFVCAAPLYGNVIAFLCDDSDATAKALAAMIYGVEEKVETSVEDGSDNSETIDEPVADEPVVEEQPAVPAE